MSAIYNLEPQPTGSVIFHTTIGELSVELFAKQTPLTCRNFLQLCIDGYYDDTIFHRLVPGFILQGGDPTGTGHGGESIYDGGAFSGDLDPWPMDLRRGRNAGPTGVGFKDEFHSRLKFNRRGLLGMANEGAPDTNGSQFFFTLDKADELTGKNTLFGRIAGDTIYTLTKIGEAEIDEASERPLYPVKITKVEVLVNPFEDMTKRTRQAPVAQNAVVVERKKKRKGGKQLLSFGDEEGDAEELPILKKPKFDTRIVMDDGMDDAMDITRPTEKKKKKTKPSSGELAETQDHWPVQPQKRDTNKETMRSRQYNSPSPETELPRRKTELERTNDEIAALKASMKRTTNPTQEVEKEKKMSALEQMLSGTAVKGGRRRGRQNVNEDQRSVDIMKGWEMKLKTAQPENEKPRRGTVNGGSKEELNVDDDDEGGKCDLHFVPNCQSCQAWDKKEQDEESGDEGFMAHTMNCKADKLGKDLSYRKKAEEELVVIDPRAKALSIKEQKKAEREARAGKSSREWDRARNAQMARAASTAGRGAT
ncbi:hypothetical protein jhhlp_001467 [Lomentospora prolificans]|uniref:peptidylprolyl isomerase n=1 Tax=Lomentospora prolificans TaxID=41688 RepID=A0A2N3NI87_9PEZI|nr:hypothetical protein jhhlp_001467 [Lomentospora prolificans]